MRADCQAHVATIAAAHHHQPIGVSPGLLAHPGIDGFQVLDGIHPLCAVVGLLVGFAEPGRAAYVGLHHGESTRDQEAHHRTPANRRGVRRSAVYEDHHWQFLAAHLLGQIEIERDLGAVEALDLLDTDGNQRQLAQTRTLVLAQRLESSVLHIQREHVAGSRRCRDVHHQGLALGVELPEGHQSHGYLDLHLLFQGLAVEELEAGVAAVVERNGHYRWLLARDLDVGDLRARIFEDRLHGPALGVDPMQASALQTFVGYHVHALAVRREGRRIGV